MEPGSACPSTSPARRVCAVIVSYKPDNYCLECMAAAAQLATAAVIVDNGSPAPTLERLQALTSGHTMLVSNPRNLGIAAALNIGMQRAHDAGYDWMLLLDHDTRLLPDALERLLAVRDDYLATQSRRLGLVGGAYRSLMADGRIQPQPEPPPDAPAWTHETAVITSGTLIGWDTFSRCGPFREDFFVDYVDFEYCLRLQAQGYAVIRTVQPIAVHRLGNLTPVVSLLSFGRRRMVTNHSPLRRYYHARNLMLLRRIYGRQFPVYLRQQTRDLRHQLVRVLKYESNAWAKLRAAIAGLRDGWRGVAGERRD